MGANSYLLEKIPFQKGGKNKIWQLSPLKVYPFWFNMAYRHNIISFDFIIIIIIIITDWRQILNPFFSFVFYSLIFSVSSYVCLLLTSDMICVQKTDNFIAAMIILTWMRNRYMVPINYFTSIE